MTTVDNLTTTALWNSQQRLNLKTTEQNQQSTLSISAVGEFTTSANSTEISTRSLAN